MSGKWQRTFEVSVPVERVWEMFTRTRPAPPAGARPDPNAAVKPQVLEVQPMKMLRWSAEGGELPERSEITVVFESTDTGSRFTVTRFGFGEGEDADVFSESNGLGWEGGLMDMVFELETGVAVNRHYYGAYDTCTGVMYARMRAGARGVESDAGHVRRRGRPDARRPAGAARRRGDLLARERVDIAGGAFAGLSWRWSSFALAPCDAAAVRCRRSAWRPWLPSASNEHRAYVAPARLD